MQRELAVASAHDAQGRNDIQAGGAQHLVFLVGQGQGRGHHDAVPGMNAHGIHVLHAADGDHVAHAVPHDLKLDFLPAGHGPLDEHLGNGGQGQTVGRDLPQGLLVRGAAAAGAAQGKGGPDDNRIADLPGDIHRFLHGMGNAGGNHRLADGLHGLLEQLPVLRLLDGVHVHADQPHAVGVQEAFLLQLHGQRQTRLSAQTGQQAVRALLLDNALQGGNGQGFQVDFIRHGLVGHDGGGVGVHQHHLDAFLLQHAACLGPRVVKLRRLADHNGARPDH